MLPSALDPNLYVSVDSPNDLLRFTYVRFDDHTVTAIALFVEIEPFEGRPCFQVDYAVDPNYRGFSKLTLMAAIEEIRTGLGQARFPPFYIEAVIDVENHISQRVAAACISSASISVVDQFNGSPSLHIFVY
jgi:hypothetical protein